MKKKETKQCDTYNRAMSHLMSRLLFTYCKRKYDLSGGADGYWTMAITQPVPEGALVVPFAIMDAREWWLGWYRGKSEDGALLVESVQTHRICKFYNTGLMFLDNLEFANRPEFRYSDRQFDMIDRIERRTAKNNYWFVVGNPVFHEDGSIDVPIRQKFKDNFYTKTYKNFKSCTIAALDEHCREVCEMEKNKEKDNQNVLQNHQQRQ